jgi:hypothetical protein
MPTGTYKGLTKVNRFKNLTAQNVDFKEIFELDVSIYTESTITPFIARLPE